MTQHLTDVEIALERGHVSDIEDAFRALVGWPNEDTIDGADARTRSILLPRVCYALRDDDRIMPGDITAIIEDAGCKLLGGSYRNGAGAVLSSIAFWSKRAGGES